MNTKVILLIAGILMPFMIPWLGSHDQEWSGQMVEICDNGIDDDGDGLIDLNDTVDCICDSLFIELSSFIANPSFEEYLSCPTSFSEIDSAESWSRFSVTTPDYYNIEAPCNYAGDSTDQGFPALPLPDGLGYTGIVMESNGISSFMEYITTCLLRPMVQDSSYQFDFDLGFGMPGMDLGPDPSTEVALFGSSSCIDTIYPMFECPVGEGDWIELGRVTLSGMNEWVAGSMTIVPPSEINAIAIGGACDYTGLSYYFLDNLRLDEPRGIGVPDVSILQTCGGSDTLVLSISDTVNAINYQWYRDGVAIAGAEDSVYIVTDQTFATYQVRVSADGACVLREVVYEPLPHDTTLVNEQLCDGGTLQIGDSTFNQTGEYRVDLTNIEGCDSTILITLTVLEVAETILSEVICEGDTLRIGDSTYTVSGDYVINLTSQAGCDSTIRLELSVGDEPFAAVEEVRPESCPGSADGALLVSFQSQDEESILWSTGDTTMQVDGLAAGTYGVTVTFASGCDSEASYRLEAGTSDQFYIPNVFSPNNDGINDEIKVFTGPSTLSVVSWRIYNRWGGLVCERIDTDTADDEMMWDGMIDDQEAAQGLYVYVLEYIGCGGQPQTLTGDLLLLR